MSRGDRKRLALHCLWSVPAGLLLVLAGRSLPLVAQSSPLEAELRAAVARLGSDDQNLQRIRLLERNPALSAGLLIRELHPVAAVRILPSEFPQAKYADALHVVWCVRALRHLTGGNNFRAGTSHRFGKSEIERNRKYFLHADEGHGVPFFATWMSRDSIYLAPRDAQEAIIAQWKACYAKEGNAFPYHADGADLDPDVWYF